MDTAYNWLERFCKRQNLPFYGIHTFRHLFASLLISEGIDIVTVSGSLGHSNVSTTGNIYCHMLDEAQAKAKTTISDALHLNADSKIKGK